MNIKNKIGQAMSPMLLTVVVAIIVLALIGLVWIVLGKGTGLAKSISYTFF